MRPLWMQANHWCDDRSARVRGGKPPDAPPAEAAVGSLAARSRKPFRDPQSVRANRITTTAPEKPQRERGRPAGRDARPGPRPASGATRARVWRKPSRDWNGSAPCLGSAWSRRGARRSNGEQRKVLPNALPKRQSSELWQRSAGGKRAVNRIVSQGVK